jgi:hypothetical protein
LIQKLDNGVTLITLGEGTVYTGLARSEGWNIPVGICFSNQQGENLDPEGKVVIQITNEKAAASYMMALFRLMETWDNDKESQFSKTIKSLKNDLEPLLKFDK